jgi:hypothetical protein
MDNIEALSPKPDEFVENKNSRHPKDYGFFSERKCGSVSTFME